ncbi:MAG: class I SAM-dependent methyltransferase [Flavobacteriales bacterium]|nr:class I SAM-dependent methyltransferase [Flavobacteriales bacterium]MBL0043022.1 class I SAM-dependent methyltransferase [Flavobacteriales bacterium]
MDPRTARMYERYYEVTYQDLSKRTGVWQAITAYLQRYVPPDGSVLDLGAGYCGFINNIKASEKYALDQSSAVEKYAVLGVKTLVGDVADLSRIASGSLHVVFASNLLEHLDDDPLASTLGEVYRVLRPHGRFIVMQPNFALAYRNYFDDFTHRRVYTHISLRDVLMTQGFQVPIVKKRFTPYSMRSSIPAHPLLVAAYLRSPWKPGAGQMLLVAEKP